MATQQVTVVRAIMVAGSLSAAASTPTIELGLARRLAAYGDVTFTDTDPGAAAGNYAEIAAGTYSWAGGAATTASQAIAGLVAGDIVVASLKARASTETLVLAALDTANSEIDFTLSANGTNTTTKIDYRVLRRL